MDARSRARWLIVMPICVLLTISIVAHAPPTPGPWWAVPAAVIGLGVTVLGVLIVDGRRYGMRLTPRARQGMRGYGVFAVFGTVIAADHATWFAAALIAVNVALAIAIVVPSYRLNRALRGAINLVTRAPTRTHVEALVALTRRHKHPSVRYLASFALCSIAPREGAAMLDSLLEESEVAGAELVGWFPSRVDEILLLRAWAASRLDEVDAARAALARLSSSLTPPREATRRLIESCLCSSQGRGAEALALLPADGTRTMFPHYLPVARAHAYAAMPDREAARAILAKLPRRHVEGIKVGPAAPIAAEVLTGAAQPYR